jgi:hypothetical protein
VAVHRNHDRLSAAAASETLPPATWPCTATTTGARIRFILTIAE